MCFDAFTGVSRIAQPATASVNHECLRRGSIAPGVAAFARRAPSSDCKAPMDYRSPLQHLLRNLLPTRGSTDPVASAPDFVDTQPVDGPVASLPILRAVAPQQRQPGTWAESALDLVLGTEIMEYPDDTAADLMDEFFAKSEQRAA